MEASVAVVRLPDKGPDQPWEIGGEVCVLGRQRRKSARSPWPGAQRALDKAHGEGKGSRRSSPRSKEQTGALQDNISQSREAPKYLNGVDIPRE